MTATVTPTICWIEQDPNDEGTCTSCGRTGLRWVVTLSNGIAVGLECAKRICGFRPAPTTYNWIVDFERVAEHVEDYEDGDIDSWVLWQAKNGRETRETRNGRLMQVGGCRKAWTKKGWL